MLEALLYVNLVLVIAGFVLGFIAMRRRTGLFLIHLVGVLGLGSLAIAYLYTIVNKTAGMPTQFVRPGLVMLLAHIVARQIHDIYSR